MHDGPPAPVLLFFFLIIALIVTAAITSYIQGKKRKKELLEFAARFGMSFDPQRRYSVDNEYPQVKEFRQGSNRYAFNTISGTLLSRPFTGFDYHYETHSTDSKGREQTHHHHFSAVIIRPEIPLKPLHMRTENIFDKIGEFFGASDIDFESAEFSRKFRVTSPDRKWAFDVLHQRAIQFMLEQPVFTIHFEADFICATRTRTFSAADFEAAAKLINGLLDQLPDYVKIEAQRNFRNA